MKGSMTFKMLFWWFSRLVFKLIKATSGLEHAHYFWESEVKRMDNDARCVHCGAPLSEVLKKPRK